MSDETILDCRGLACPQPVIETKKALAEATAPFVALVDSEASCTNVRRFAESQGARVSVTRRGDEHRVTIDPGRDQPAAEEPPVVCSPAGSMSTVVYISSEGMGRGDEELGATLMAAFLDTLSQFRDEVATVVLVNAGARLATAGSPVLDQLRQLEQLGVRVLVCGTCLRYFGLESELAAGSISNMFAIIEALTGAGKVIRP